MQRDIIAKLNAWKASEYRKPLILKGARQVGKTWALKEFGRTSYINYVYLTLEEPSPGVQSEYAQFFEGTRDPRRIISNLSLALGQPIDPGETLLIIDEIQDCPSAVGALKYFCDEAPSITSHAQGLCWAFACPVRPALFRWERSSSWRCTL